jgi:hypothetical protein
MKDLCVPLAGGFVDVSLAYATALPRQIKSNRPKQLLNSPRKRVQMFHVDIAVINEIRAKLSNGLRCKKNIKFDSY